MAEGSKRSVRTGRYVVTNSAGTTHRDSAGATAGRSVSQSERAAAARARVSADKKRGAVTAPWIVELARQVS